MNCGHQPACNAKLYRIVYFLKLGVFPPLTSPIPPCPTPTETVPTMPYAKQPFLPRRRPVPVSSLTQAALVAAFLVFPLFALPTQAQMGPRAMPVAVEEVQPESLDVHSVYAGRAHGARAVEVRARVSGVLEERLYAEGQVVERGTPLFLIDSQPFEVAVQRAVAERGRAYAELQHARRDWQRVSELFQRGTASARDRDSARAAVETAEALLALAEAGVAQAQLDLDYAQVQAPLSGVTGLESLPEGSLIDRGTLLTTITQLDPIHVRFALPGSASPEVMEGGTAPYTVHLILPDGSVYAHAGTVDFTNSTVDPETGTILARAAFPNPRQQVRPGQFVRVRMQTASLENVFLVPSTAILQGPTGPIVYSIVAGEGAGEGDVSQVAQAHPVVLGPVVEGRQVILSGLSAGDRLVVNGQVALRPGAPVIVTNAPAPPEGGN